MILYDGFSGPCRRPATPSFSSRELGPSFPMTSGPLLVACGELLVAWFLLLVTDATECVA